MSVPKDDRVYLWDMLTAARAVVDFVRGHTLAEYEADLLFTQRGRAADRDHRRSRSPHLQGVSGRATPRFPGDQSKPKGMCSPMTTARSSTTVSGGSPRRTYPS
jgi:hypothetical protein